MANEDETLTFRLRAVAENMGAFNRTARAAEDVNQSMIRSRKTAEQLTVTNRKLTQARDREADAAGRVRVAEAQLDELRRRSNTRMSQIAAAEERLATARRNSSRAADNANRLEADFRTVAERALNRVAEDAGDEAGRRFFLGFRKQVRSGGFDDEIEDGSKIIGSTFGSGILNGLQTSLKSKAGPAILAALLTAAAIASPAIGAVLAGGIVTAFGAGLATLGIVFASKTVAVRTKWRTTVAAMGQDMRLISKPFEDVLIHIANSARTEFGKFRPILQQIFGTSAGPIQRFADDVIAALGRLRPALLPIGDAFNMVLASLGPALKTAIDDIAQGLITLSESVRANPTGLADLVRGVGDLTQSLLGIIAHLNNVNGAFERLTGGTSAVTVVMEVLKGAIHTLLAPILVLTQYIGVVSSIVDKLRGGTNTAGASMADAAAHTATLAQELRNAGGAATGAASPVKTVADRTAEAKRVASEAAAAFEDWIGKLFRLQGLAISVAQAQLGLKQAVSQAGATIRENGKNINLNTAAGQENRAALLQVAQAANTETEALIRNNSSQVTLASRSKSSRDAFVRLAVQMGFSGKAANKMADDMIAIPNVSREAKLTANKRDLEAKLRAAKTQLADKNLTKERRAQINANIAKLQAALRRAQAQINGLKGKTVEIKYTSNGVNLTTPSRVGGVATGGKILGPGSGTSDRAGVFALSNNEWVIKSKSAQKYGDHAMSSVNAGTATILPGMATGGKVTARIHTRNLFNSVSQGRAILTQMLGGPALAFAKSQAGKPYLWGGVGPSGYDCSGFMSAIVNVIRGQNPHRRLFATGSLPGPYFAKGTGRFNVGWFKGNPGHMAGTLNGVNVESRGGRGVVVGAGARGASNSLFNSGIWHLKGYAQGGKVVGDPPFDGFAEWLAGLKSYATGTPYVPRDGMAYLHKGEAVHPAGEPLRLHPADIKALAKALAAAMSEARLRIDNKGGRAYGLLKTNG